MAIVLIIQEQEITHKIPLSGKPLILGRSSKCDLKLQDPMVSGKHCAFLINEEGKATVKDLDSSNGTFVNGFKIAETHVMMDDEVTIGAIKCWLDATQLNPKEKKVHVRETAKTRMKFINLEESAEKVPRKEQINKKKEVAPPQDDFDPKTSIIKIDLDEIGDAKEQSPEPNNETEEDFTRTQIAKAPEKLPESDSSDKSNNDRLAKRVKQMEEKSKQQSSDPGQSIAGENEFENEETGNTKFLKVDTRKSKKANPVIKKKKPTQKEEVGKEGNLFGKLKGIFKK